MFKGSVLSAFEPWIPGTTLNHMHDSCNQRRVMTMVLTCLTDGDVVCIYGSLVATEWQDFLIGELLSFIAKTGSMGKSL
jgi:hypothetical protein